jgi:hypothetical protein
MSAKLFDEAAALRKKALTELRDMAVSASVEDDAMFVEVLKLARLVLELSDGRIADELLVSRPTVNRWLNGQNDPHPAMRKPVFTWIAREAASRLRTLEPMLRASQADHSSRRQMVAGT